jgi:hypothetical protein
MVGIIGMVRASQISVIDIKTAWVHLLTQVTALVS